MPVTYPTNIIDSDDILNYLGLENLTPSQNDTIDMTISNVESYIESYCEQPIIPTDVVTTFDGNGMSYQMLREFPVLSLTSLTFYADPLIDGVSYTPGVDCKLLKKENVFYAYLSSGYQTGGLYELNYKVGYAEIPNDVFQVGIEMVATKLKESDILGASGGRLGMQTINTSGIQGFENSNVTFKDLEPRWKSVLNKYKRPNW